MAEAIRTKIHVTYAQYTDFGYSAIPEGVYLSIITRAGLFAEEQTLGRVKWLFKPPEPIMIPEDPEDPDSPLIPKPLTELEIRNMRGVCDLANVFFRNEAAVGESGAAIISFTNEGYREVYEAGSREGSRALLQSRIQNVMFAYFTAAQRSRRVMHSRRDYCEPEEE